MSGGPETIETGDDERQAGASAAAIVKAARIENAAEAATFGLSRERDIFGS